MLTVGQLLAIENPGAAPPLRASSLQRNFKTTPLSLRTSINQLQGQKAYFFVNLRDISLITGGAVDNNGNKLGPASTLQEVQARWAVTSSTSSTLTTFMKTLGNNGNVNWLSADRQTYGVLGTVGSLANIPIVILAGNQGPLTAAGGLVGLGATLMTIASIPEPASPIIFAVGAGLALGGSVSLTGVGIWWTITGDSPPKPAGTGTGGPTSDANDPTQGDDIDPSNIYGSPPPDDNVTATAIAESDAPSIDITQLPYVPGWGGGPGDGTDDTGVGDPGNVGDVGGGGLGFG